MQAAMHAQTPALCPEPCLLSEEWSPEPPSHAGWEADRQLGPPAVLPGALQGVYRILDCPLAHR